MADLLFTAGQPGIDPKTGTVVGPGFETQARQAFENLRAVLEDAGSSMEQVVRVTCFMADGLLFSIDAIAVVGPGHGA